MKSLRSALAAGLVLLSLGLAPAATGQTALVSINSAGTNSANANSLLKVSDQFCHYSRQCMSTDGRFVVFLSEATDLTAVPDTNGAADVFVRDNLLGTTTLVTINSSGTAAANTGAVLSAFISADGTKVAFVSSSSDLVATDTNGAFDVFVRDLVGGTTTLASVNAAGTDSGNGVSWFVVPNSETPGPVISADGNRVVFNSDANNLVATDTNGGSDAFVRDVSGATTTLVSVNLAGTDSGNLSSFATGISADGNRLVFSSNATDLVATPDANAFPDIFVRDLMAGTTTLVSINVAGTSTGSGPGDSRYPVISDDGTHVAFLSYATDLTTLPDANVDLDLFVRDLGSGTTSLASVNAAGTSAGNNGVSIPGQSQTGFSLSADGNRVAFSSAATDLTTIPDTNGTVQDLFARDLGTGTTFLVTVNSAGTDTGNAGGYAPVISADGARVVFSSDSTDLVTSPILAIFQVYERDLAAGTTALVSFNSAGAASGNSASEFITISGDGSMVVFQSAADDLVLFGVDTNSASDVFLRPLVLTPSISIDDVSVTETDVGTVNAMFTVSLSAPSVATVTVDFIANGVTATSGTDFVFTSGTLTFLPTQVTQPVSVTVNGDTLDEFNETFTVDLSNPSLAAIADTQGVGTILDNDPVPSISINDVAQAEANAGTTNMTFTVSLSAVSGKNVSVNYLTADNSATQPSDYTLTSGTLMILAGNPSGPISVPIVGDTAPEPNETFFMNLSVPGNATILDGQGQGTITDDDSGPPFTVSASESSITCTAGATAHFNVTLTPSPPPFNNPVNFSCSGNPPLSTCTVTPSSVTPGSNPATVQVQIHSTGSSALRPPLWEREQSTIYAVMLLPGLGLVSLVLVTPSPSKRCLRRLLEIALLLATSLALMTSGCGGGGTGTPGTPSGTYTVTITGTSVPNSNSTTVTLTIHQ